MAKVHHLTALGHPMPGLVLIWHGSKVKTECREVRRRAHGGESYALQATGRGGRRKLGQMVSLLKGVSLEVRDRGPHALTVIVNPERMKGANPPVVTPFHRPR
jgi:hypothetical protein